MTATAELRDTIERDGVALIPSLICQRRLEALRAAMEAQVQQGGIRRGGARNLLRVHAVRLLAACAEVREVVDAVLGPGARAVRGVLFDKTPDANWNVAWHQDVMVPVRARGDVSGFSRWSVKDGVLHAQPPVAVLEGMLAVRLHLDPCASDNGPLRVLPGSHSRGLLSDEEVEASKAALTPIVCEVPAGGAVLMRPLLLHASSAAAAPARRRVIHLEYAASALPGGLEWGEA